MSIEILAVDYDLQLDCVTQQLAFAGYIAQDARGGSEAMEWL